ncbi:hypothetical protein BDW02DRAFT_569283 [Decorospora gaudefroyi]|uniref:Extracellular membrane protein CFEM domain-containing protein n=1 Tax=Decorospora gaudefroyi TaxID=184978 RepID=A0A6A5KF42_9PLEO|nr:hypothetical protein BDW02DRAFT_569283 [Decorospora gaudefroyi]
MRSPAAQWLLFAQLFALGVAAHRDWWLQTLPQCWQDCLANTQNGCSSRKCICNSGEESASYLPSAVACAVSACEAADWTVELALRPLQLYCEAIDCAIPDEVMDDAYAATSGTRPPSSTTRQAHFATDSTSPERTSTSQSDGGGDLTSTINPAVTASPSSTTASPSPSAHDSSPASTSASGSEETKTPANGNGSPFENMQAGASKRTMSVRVLGLVTATLAMLFV